MCGVRTGARLERRTRSIRPPMRFGCRCSSDRLDGEKRLREGPRPRLLYRLGGEPMRSIDLVLDELAIRSSTGTGLA